MAGNARFHDKQHRKNHHTLPTVGYPDSGNDPIASPSEPFQGDFVVNGRLSASTGIDILSAHIQNDVDCENLTVRGTTFTNLISGQGTETIISDDSLIGHGDRTLTMDFGLGIYAQSPIFNITNALSVVGDVNIDKELTVVGYSTLSSVKANNSVYLDYPTLEKIDSKINNAKLTIRSTDGDSVNIVRSNNTSNEAGIIKSFRSRGNLNSKTSVLTNDLIFGLQGLSYNGTTYNNSVGINAWSENDQTPLNGGGYLTFHTCISSDVNNQQERLRITGSGNVGIGTTSPSEKLHVDGNIFTTGNVFIEGNLSAMGDVSYLETTVFGSSAITLENHSSIPAISAKQITGTLIAAFNNSTEDVVSIYSTGLSAKNAYFGNKIGIGNSSPTYTLDVTGKIRGTGDQGALIASNLSGSNQTSIYLKREDAPDDRKIWEIIQYNEGGINSGGFAIRTISDNYLSSGECFVATRAPSGILINTVSLHTNSNNRFHITSAGNIGIGTTSPDSKLHTIGSAIFTNSSDSSQNLLLSSNSVGNSIIGQSRSGTPKFLRLESDSNSYGTSFITSNTERMRILSSGYVCIGDMSEISGCLLYVSGGITIPSNNYINFDTVSGGGNTAIRKNTSDNGLEFFTNKTSRMFISDSGFVSIGTLSSQHAPEDKLEVAGNIGSYGFRVRQGSPNGNPLSDSSSNGYAFGDDGDTGMFSPSANFTANSALGIVGLYCNNIETTRTFISAGQKIFTIGGLSAASEDYVRTALVIGDSNRGGLIELRDGGGAYSTIYRDALTDSLWLDAKGTNSSMVLSTRGTGTLTIGTSGNNNAITVNLSGYLGVNNPNPTQPLTVSGNISSNKCIYALSGFSSTKDTGYGDANKFGSVSIWDNVAFPINIFEATNDPDGCMIRGFRARGSDNSNRTPTMDGDVIMAHRAYGGYWKGTIGNFSYTDFGVANIYIRAAGNTTDSNHGATMNFTTNTQGTTATGDTSRIFINGAGNVGIGTTGPAFKLDVNGSVAGIGAYNVMSDKREKENINYSISYGLSTINELKPAKFDYIEHGKDNIGFIAQDIIGLVPELISTHTKEISGKNEERYSLKETSLIPILVKAIQELNEKVEAQAKEIAILKKKKSN